MSEIESILDKWANDFKVFSHPVRLAILFVLYATEQVKDTSTPCVRFGKLQVALDNTLSNKSGENLAYHLNPLIEGEFVRRVPYQKNEGKDNVDTVYMITEKGEEFLRDFGVLETIEEQMRDIVQVSC